VTVIRTLAFAELHTPGLGVAWVPENGEAATIAVRVGTGVRVLTARLEDGAGPEPWRLEGDGVSLLFTATGPAAHGGAADAEIDSTDQLCEVTGTVVVGGGERAIGCMGSRTSLNARFDLAAIASFRQTAGWFGANEGPGADGLSLASYRRGKARGQDKDLVAAAVLEPDPAPPVADPRLSTTYDAAGLPTRVGLELWFEPDESGEDTGGDERRHFPRRAAAELAGEPIRWGVADFRLDAVPLRWHSRGHAGAGMYLLGQRG
jgi:hypothetical protein